MALQEEMEVQGNFLFRYRSNIPLVILLVGMIVYIHNELSELGRSVWYFEDTYPFLCLGVSLLGLMVRIFTVGYTPRNTSGRNTAEGQVAEQLNTSGIYSLVRHPLYLGNFLMWLGVAMMTENIWFLISFVLAYWIYYERIMFAEEQFLRRKFKEHYLNWAAKTPAFIPCFSNFRRPQLPFSLKKVLKKEKDGFFLVFLMFFVFKSVEHYIEVRKLMVVKDFWFFALLSALLIYGVLKILKKYTRVFYEEGR